MLPVWGEAEVPGAEVVLRAAADEAGAEPRDFYSPRYCRLKVDGPGSWFAAFRAGAEAIRCATAEKQVRAEKRQTLAPVGLLGFPARHPTPIPPPSCWRST